MYSGEGRTSCPADAGPGLAPCPALILRCPMMVVAHGITSEEVVWTRR